MTHPRDLDFDPPGPGVWSTDGLHTPKPITRMKQATYSSLPKGMRIGMSRYGALSEGISIAILHRFVYLSPQMLATRPPGNDNEAKAAFIAQASANPELQERFERAEFTLTTKRWRADKDHWDTTGKSWVMGRTLALTDEQPTLMTDKELVFNVQQSIHHLTLTMEYHHILNLVPSLPRCLLFLDVGNWTGLSTKEMEPLLLGSSPISAGDEPELRALCEALDTDSSALSELTSGEDAGAIINGLARRDDATGAALSTYIRMVGFRTLDGWEPMNPYILETPELLIEKIIHGMKRSYPKADPDAIESIRNLVPKGSQATFDELLDDARTCSRIKDERDLYCNMPMCGVLRRSIIEAGGRAAQKGLINDIEHMTEASSDEVRQILIGGRSDLGDELHERYEYRMKYSIDDVPQTIGDASEMPQPIDPGWLPAASSRFSRAMGINLMLNSPVDEANDKDATVLKGRPVSAGSFEGIARVVKDAAEINDLQQGEILITRSTNPAFNIVLPRLGALVTQYGGVLSHAAIVAREFGIPGIVGCKEATKKVETGDRLTVNGDTGEVTLHRA